MWNGAGCIFVLVEKIYHIIDFYGLSVLPRGAPYTNRIDKICQNKVNAIKSIEIFDIFCKIGSKNLELTLGLRGLPPERKLSLDEPYTSTL